MAEESCAWIERVSRVNSPMCTLHSTYNLLNHMFDKNHCLHGVLNLNDSKDLANKGKRTNKSYTSMLSILSIPLTATKISYDYNNLLHGSAMLLKDMFNS